MYVNIDMSGMRVVHAHPAREVCSALAALELPHVPVRTLPVQYPADLEDFTDYELGKLYKGLTGQAAPGFYRPHVQRGIVAAVALLQPADVDLLELQAQLRAVPQGDSARYMYVKGSAEPRPWEDVFAMVLGTADHTRAQANAAAVPASPPPLPQPTLTPTTAPAAQPAARQPAARPPSAKPGGGETVAQLIYRVCDETRAANPHAALPEVRKLAISKLADLGINANSASKGSGLWLKFIQDNA